MREKTIKAELILEDGTRFKGKAFGHIKEVTGEVIFTTIIPGYQEILTDSAFSGQIVCMTYPLIGNYGINLDDMESNIPKPKALIVKEKCNSPNNWCCEMELEGFFKQHKIMGLEGIDTRMLTGILRDKGSMKGILTTRVDDLTETQIQQKFNVYSNKNAVADVTVKAKYSLSGVITNLAIIDLGIKKSVLNEFRKRKCKITVYPAFTKAEEILADNPDGIFVSNGPGNPHDISEIIENVKILINKKPVVGTGLGHYVIGLALGLEVGDLKCKHHGSAPIKDLKTGRVYAAPQNSCYYIKSVSDKEDVTFKAVNDSSIAGIKHKTLPIYSVQFNPEASPGAYDTNFIFDKMLDIINAGGKNNA